MLYLFNLCFVPNGTTPGPSVTEFGKQDPSHAAREEVSIKMLRHMLYLKAQETTLPPFYLYFVPTGQPRAVRYGIWVNRLHRMRLGRKYP